MKKYLNDIRFWILLFFLIRLIGILQPPLEIGHNWRQTTVTMVARNFLEVDNNIFYPRIDIAGEKTGITGMEFPFLNYLIYLISEIFGYEHWYGRLINLIVSSIGIMYFFKLLEKYLTKEIAFYSSIVLLASIWFSFSRKIMPDTFSMSLILAGIYYGSNYLDRSKKLISKELWIYIFLIALGILAKLPSGYMLVLFAFLILNKEILFQRKVIFSLATLIAVSPALIWYFYWVPFLVEEYGFWHFFMGKSFSQGFHEIIENSGDSLKRFYETALKYIGFVVFAFGLILSIIKKDVKVYSIFALSFAAFLIIVFKAGFNFSHHSYYIVPFAPIMAMVAGYGLTQIKYKKWQIILLVAICLEGLLNQQHDFKIKDEAYALIELESDLDTFSSREDLILINSGTYPSPMYFAHRKGWVMSNEQLHDDEEIAVLKSKGLAYIVVLKRFFGVDTQLDFEIVLDNQDYRIYKL